MRHRVTLKPSIFADKMQPAYADGYAIYCTKCNGIPQLNFYETEGDAIRQAVVLARAPDVGDCRYSVVPVVSQGLVLDSANTMVIWQPTAHGLTTKSALTLADYHRLFERVEE